MFIQKRNLIRLLQEYVRYKLIINQAENKINLDNFKSAILKIEEFNEWMTELTNGQGEVLSGETTYLETLLHS